MSEENKIIDAVSLIDVLTVGSAPAMAMGQLYYSLAFNSGMASMNMVLAAQQAYEAQQAATTQGVKLLLGSS
ncbi:RebB family R body protein [Planctobacterium marinum]|uniref:RebB family R body protein n=1 Tax=Planctobacterium marinum TaxID=1631968 RepID=UPI001E29B725|nr:RebB family R body protein [Planctobacterium marinum]MCC2605105.1 RebB family R body protein [Planctobacterium marinum]